MYNQHENTVDDSVCYKLEIDITVRSLKMLDRQLFPGDLEARVQYSQPDLNLWPRNQNPASSYYQLRSLETSTWKGSGCPTWRLSEPLLLGVYGGFII